MSIFNLEEPSAYILRLRALGTALINIYPACGMRTESWARSYVGQNDPGMQEVMRGASVTQLKLWRETWPHVNIAVSRMTDLLVQHGCDPLISEYIVRGAVTYQILAKQTAGEIIRVRILAGLRGKYKPMQGAWTRLGSHLSYVGGVADALTTLLIAMYEKDPQQYDDFGLLDVGRTINAITHNLVRAPQDARIYT